MKESLSPVDESWAEQNITNFETIPPMEAMDQFVMLADTGGETAINNDPRRTSIIKAIAGLKDGEISEWASRTGGNDYRAVHYYDEKMKYYRTVCTKALGHTPAETKAN